MPRGVYIRTIEYRQKQREAMARREINPGQCKSEATRRKIGDAQRGKPKSEEFRNNLSALYKGKPSFWKGKTASLETRLKMSAARRGEKHYNWRGGVTPIHARIRSSAEYCAWRDAIYKRDGYACTQCGIKGVMLNADHIKPFSTHPELRFDLSNGRTLCVPCHKATPTYGSKLRTA